MLGTNLWSSVDNKCLLPDRGHFLLWIATWWQHFHHRIREMPVQIDYNFIPIWKEPRNKKNVKRKFTILIISLDTLYNAILRIARNFLETRENIKISTHPFYHVNLDWFSWEWSKKKFFLFWKKIQNGRFSKMAIFQNRQFSKFFRENFTDSSLG